MWDLAVAAASAFGVVFVAELGDKTQFLALGFGARHSLRTVIIGLAIGYAAAGAIAAVAGGLLGATLPQRPLGIAAGLLFLAFAVATFLDRGDAIDNAESSHIFSAKSVVASVALTIAVGELGDKTQLATAALAARSNPVAVWIGATGGELLAGAIGAVAGLKIGTRLHPRSLRLASAAMFALFGAVLLVLAI